MVDAKDLLGELLSNTPEKRAIKKAGTQIDTYLKSKNKRIGASFSANLIDPKVPLFDFKLFDSGTIFRAKFDGAASGYAWFVAESEEDGTHVVLVRNSKGDLNLGENLSKQDFKFEHVLRSGEVFPLADLVARLSGSGSDFKTTAVDIMSGGLTPGRGKPVYQVGPPVRMTPIENENPNK